VPEAPAVGRFRFLALDDTAETGRRGCAGAGAATTDASDSQVFSYFDGGLLPLSPPDGLPVVLGQLGFVG